MRKLILATLFFPLLVACNTEVERENEKLKTENQELRRETQAQDSLINEFVVSFTRIQENLATIREKEERIQQAREGNLEKSMSSRDEVIKDIEVINELLSENRQTIASLNKRLSAAQYENQNLNKMIRSLNNQVNEKDSQVVVLKENLAAVNFEMSALNNRLQQSQEVRQMQEEEITRKTEALNTAYYAIGTYDDLEENNVIDKKGGLLGIGRTKTLADDFNRDYFTQVDITKTTLIPIETEEDEARLITNHPSDTYKWNKTDDVINSLEILDPARFWGNAKYLVIVLD